MLQAEVSIPLVASLGDGLVNGSFEVGHAVTVTADPAEKLHGTEFWKKV
jgi:hypothetical protein